MPFVKSKNLFGIIALSALWLSSCQFGNKNSTELTGYDTISGYYSSLPQTITFHAEIGTGPARDQIGLVNQMPALLKTVMANPTMLYYDDPINGIGSLRAHADTSNGIPTRISDHQGTFGVSTSASATIPGCIFKKDTLHTGKFTQAATTTVVNGMTVRGSISIDYTMTYTFVGADIDCDPLRANFKSCYIDGTGCSTDTGSIFYRPFVQEIFSPLVNSGIMTDAEIGSAKVLTYHATYE
jgi:hypothetical protein